MSKSTKINSNVDLAGGTFWLTRIVFLRCLAFVYNVAFLIAFNQNKALIGRKGLLPADLYLKSVRERLGNPREPLSLLSAVPTLFWFIDDVDLDLWLDAVALGGAALSFLILLSGAANMGSLALLWALYHSLVGVGQAWYSFGWESQLLETGFLAIWAVPLWSWARLPPHSGPSRVSVLAFRWLIARIMLGAGLIKLRGDACWQLDRLSCMDFHYETQPVPNPAAYFMHQSPKIIHKAEVLGNHFVELVAPLLLFFPHRGVNALGGVIQISFMGVIVLSGNLSFLNHLTMLPSLWAFDDRFLAPLFSTATRKTVAGLQNDTNEGHIGVGWGSRLRRIVNVGVGVLIAYLSIPVVQNLFFAQRQQMNTSFEPLRLVNTYGAFGSITKERTEVIMQGTLSEDPSEPSAVWAEYEFRCKPGRVGRRPCLISPYHYRLDWLMWFAAFQNYQQNPWLIHFVIKMLENDEQVSTLIAENPFLTSQPPKLTWYIRLQHYRYTFTKLGTSEKWWKRKKIGEYLPAVSLKELKPIATRFGWDRKV